MYLIDGWIAGLLQNVFKTQEGFVSEGCIYFIIVLQLNTFRLMLSVKLLLIFYIYVLKNMTWSEKIQDETTDIWWELYQGFDTKD